MSGCLNSSEEVVNVLMLLYEELLYDDMTSVERLRNAKPSDAASKNKKEGNNKCGGASYMAVYEQESVSEAIRVGVQKKKLEIVPTLWKRIRNFGTHFLLQSTSYGVLFCSPLILCGWAYRMALVDPKMGKNITPIGSPSHLGSQMKLDSSQLATCDSSNMFDSSSFCFFKRLQNGYTGNDHKMATLRTPRK